VGLKPNLGREVDTRDAHASPSRDRGARGLVVAALALVALPAALWLTLDRSPPGQGFRVQRAHALDACGVREHAPTTAIVAEPFAPRRDGAEGCERYEAFAVVRRARRSAFELVVGGRAELRVDERLVLVQRNPSGLRSVRAEVALSPGIHRVTIVHTHAAGEAYLRVHEDDVSDSHFEYGLPPLDRGRYFVDEDRARAALRGPSSRASPLRALLAGAALFGAGLCAWLAHRVRAGQPLPRPDLALALAVSSLALFVRARGIPAQDLAWDELAYTLAGRHYVRNLRLGDFAAEAFRNNFYHPPLAKWIYGFGFELGGQDGARMLAALLGAAAVGFGYATARVLFDRSVASIGAAISAFLPGLVAHARLTGLETPLVFFWSASLLAGACWLTSADRPRPALARPGLLLAPAFIAASCAVLAAAVRLTAIWIAPVLLLVLALGWPQLTRRERARTLLAALLGALLAAGLVLALWPWLARAPLAGWATIRARWATQLPTEVFLGVDRSPPPVGYYAAAFFATTPLFVLLAAALGTGFGLRAPATRRATLFVLAALAAPFLQSFAAFRQDLARYVIQAWPALACLAALAAGRAGAWLAQTQHARWRPLAFCVLPAYTALALLRVEPYPLDYFNAAVGGPAGVARSHAFEVAWWGEGFRDGLAYLATHAERGARVQLALEPSDAVPHLRDDLRRVSRPPADYVVTNHYKLSVLRPRGCALVHRVSVQGAPLVDVYRCPHAPSAR